MIESLFPTNILIKDYELSNDWNSKVTSITRAVFADAFAKKQDYAAAGNDPVGLFTEDNFKECPELLDLQQMFIDGFYELACSYSNNALTKEVIAENIRKDFGKVPFMRKGDYKSIHSHDAMADAFGVFYLTDIDNEAAGGNLVLHDPSFHGAYNFHEERTYNIETKKHRLLICPNHIWHEVRLYTGDTERIAIVVNLGADGGVRYQKY